WRRAEGTQGRRRPDEPMLGAVTEKTFFRFAMSFRWARGALALSEIKESEFMWIPKWQRDRKKGVDSPIPTQVGSNEEFIPRPQNDQQRTVEYLTGVLAEEKAKKLGMDRRRFMTSSMGMATAFLASNMVYGNYWEVDPIETLEPAATEEKWPKGEYFIFDVQTHFTNGLALNFRNAEFVRN